MFVEGGFVSGSVERRAQISVDWQKAHMLHEQEKIDALNEAEKLRISLINRSEARELQAASIEAKLNSGFEVIKSGHKVKGLTEADIISVDPTDGSRIVALSERQRERLQQELGFIRTYYTRHPISEKAINKHTWIKFGLNYPEVKRQHTLGSNSKLK